MPRKPRDEYPAKEDRELPTLEVHPIVFQPARLGPARKKLTIEIVQQYCRALDLPCTHEEASAIVGFSPRTIRSWLAAGEDEDCADELLVEFASRVAQVMAGGRRAAHKRLVEEHATFDPKSAMFLVNTYNPSTRIEKTMKVDMTVAPKKPNVDYSKLSDEQFAILEQADRIKLMLENNDGS